MPSAASILGLDAVRFIEPFFSSLTDDYFTSVLLDLPGDQGRLLVDEESDPIALALHSDGQWFAGSFHLRSPTATLIERFEETAGDIYQEGRAVWAAAVRDYYSRDVMATITPAMDDLNPDRIPLVASLLDEVWGFRKGITCLDCCCGSGIGSLVLRSRGISPLSYDIDEGLLARGLQTGRLLPEETMCIDAACAESYVGHAPLGLGLMFGEINAFNQDLWGEITFTLLDLTDDALITVGKKDEAGLIGSWVSETDKQFRSFENERDPIYDRWVCVITG
ncbi:MAG: hypothetical protein LUQ69_05440 [Methanoregulaceae archaeon]|nr:hypothetical protein [Methanoregulaceae archaeon]